MHPVRKAFHAWRDTVPEGQPRTIEAFADHVGYSADTIYRQMRGEHVPPIQKAEKYASLLGWSVGKFITACHAKLQRRTA